MNVNSLLLARLVLLLASFFLTSPLAYGNTSTSVPNQDHPGPSLSIPDEKIKLAETLLLISKEWDPSLDLKKYQSKLDQLTEKIRKQIAGKDTPEAIVAVLRQVIHREEGYAYTDQVDENNIPLNPAEIFMHGLLDTKRGYCMTLSLLYLVVGEKLNLPLYGIALPNHFLVRYESDNASINIETTQEGVTLPDSYYRQRFNIPVTSTFFMRPLGKNQSLGSYYSNVGMTYYKRAMPEQAIYFLKLATLINPESIEAHNNLGNIYAELKQYDSAIKQYQLALESNPDDMSTLFNLGIAYADAGSDSEAIEAFLQVAQIDPSYVPAHRALVQLFLNNRRYISALLHLKKLVALDPESVEVRLTMASVYLRLNQYDLSLEVLKKTQSLFPENTGVFSKLAETYYRMGKFDLAISQYRRLIEYSPDNLEAYVQLGWTFYKKGDLSMAITWTKRGLSQAKEPPHDIVLAHMNLGLYYLLDEKFSEAESWYRKALASETPDALGGMIQDLEDAAGTYQKLAEIDYFAGWLLFEAGEREKGEPFLLRYLSRAPNGRLAEKAQDLLENKNNKSLISLTSMVSPVSDVQTDTSDHMVLIPEGPFIMGSNDHGEDERPEHKVYLDVYWIDKYEVNAGEYAKFLSAVKNKGYFIPSKFGTLDDEYQPVEGFAAYPINNVTWFGAAAYCRWKNKRLPTEAEWEKAARGPNGQAYPWGDAKPTQDKARFFKSWTEEIKQNVMVPVNSMPEGKSPYGVHHMAGNVKEWVDDWYFREYYQDNEHKKNPPGPIGGEFKSIRGGSWRDLTGHIYSSFRNSNSPESGLDDYGFRCAKNVKETEIK